MTHTQSMTPRESQAERRLRRLRQIRFDYGPERDDQFDRLFATLKGRMRAHNERRAHATMEARLRNHWM